MMDINTLKQSFVTSDKTFFCDRFLVRLDLDEFRGPLHRINDFREKNTRQLLPVAQRPRWSTNHRPRAFRYKIPLDRFEI